MRNNTFSDESTPELVARSILQDLYTVVVAPTDLNGIAEKLNIVIRREYIDSDILGACMAEGLKRLVVIAPDIRPLGRERFTLAHEIGHIMLRHSVCCCRNEDITWDSRRIDREQEANRFAAELLMPSSVMAGVVKRKGVKLGLVEALASEWQVSVTAMAIRMVQLSQDPVILICMENDRIKWVSYSRDSHFVEITKDITRDRLDRMQKEKQYDASEFLACVPEDATCWAEARCYDGSGYYLCVITPDDNCW